jgi:hypothetical protein
MKMRIQISQIAREISPRWGRYTVCYYEGTVYNYDQLGTAVKRVRHLSTCPDDMVWTCLSPESELWVEDYDGTF